MVARGYYEECTTIPKKSNFTILHIKKNAVSGLQSESLVVHFLKVHFFLCYEKSDENISSLLHLSVKLIFILNVPAFRRDVSEIL